MNYRTAHSGELANSLTHGLGLALSLAAFVSLVLPAARHGDAWQVVGCAVFGSTLVSLYLVSTLYHSLREPRLKSLFRLLDHACIYLLIAGTYTPVTLVNLRGGWGWTLFGLVWGFALVGIGCKVFIRPRGGWLSTASYVLLGWTALIAIKPLMEELPGGELVLLLAGGLSYTFGVAFYLWQGPRYTHAVWHLFVLAGSAFHYLAVVRYVLPATA